MTAYYNEHDPYAAQWLRNLIKAGHIAPGEVDERSIEDVRHGDLAGFTQCHWFAGVGVWSLALRRAGWPDDRPVWTGSCPCQPFSAAGKGLAFADERHLWPAWFHLISQCKPAIVLGEQVASKDSGPWIDLVHADLEGLGYAFGCIPFPAAGVGAPHIRDRLYWAGVVGVGLADTDSLGFSARAGAELHDAEHNTEPCGGIRRLADADGIARGQGCALDGWRDQGGDAQPRAGSGGDGTPDAERPGPANGFWRTADWLGCTDGKWRPVEPGAFPLAHGPAGRVGRVRAGWDAPAGPGGFGHRAGRLKGYGNAVNAEAARVFIECVFD